MLFYSLYVSSGTNFDRSIKPRRNFMNSAANIQPEPDESVENGPSPNTGPV
jgi:hypothetical protein